MVAEISEASENFRKQIE